MGGMGGPGKGRPFWIYILGAFFVIVFLVVAGFTAIDYSNERTALEGNALMLQTQTEENINNSVHTIDTGLKLFDDTLNTQMEDGFNLFIEEYNGSGNDPSKIDLAALKRSLGGQMELYVINESGVVVYTTYPPELGLDFKKTIPYFYEYLNDIRAKSGFFPDRVVQESATGQLRKFAYMPTPDHRYVLELGLSGEAFTSSRSRLKYTGTVAEIASYNPYIEKTRIFTTAKRLVGNKSYVPGSALNNTLAQVLSEKKSIEIRDNMTGQVMKYLYIDLRDSDYAADMSLIVELTYNRSLISAALDRMVLSRIAIAFFALLASSFIAILVSRRLTRPIQEMVTDADRIAKGDLNHTVRGGVGKEFDVLGESINSMIDKLKETIRMQQETESGLRSSEERYHEISDLISDYAYAIEVREDGSYRLEWATGAFLQIFGYTAEELLGKDAGYGIVHPDDKDAVAEFLGHMNSNQPYSREFRITAKNGETRWVSQRNQPRWDREKDRLAGYYVAGQDVTGRKKVEEEIRSLNEELEARVSERTAQLLAINRELESFSYMVSHDLQAPLRAIDGFSHILSEEFGKELPPDAQRYLRLVGDNAVQMHRLIEDLLNFSRTTRQSLSIERISPGTIVRECIERLRPLWTGREVEFSIGELPDCDADPALLRQVYMNLLSNALKFTRTREHALIGIDSYIDRGTVVYYVKDNGVGFDMKYAERMFGVFQRFHSSREYEGTGLGLAIVQRVVHRHGGRVWAKGEAGAGATFFFTLSKKPDDD